MSSLINEDYKKRYFQQIKSAVIHLCNILLILKGWTRL